MSETPCEFLAWDSEFFDLRIGCVRGRELTEEKVAEIRSWCREREIDCLYFLACGNDARTVRLAESDGYGLVDVRVTFERYLTDRDTSPAAERSIRRSRDEDLKVLVPVARASHRQSRFYFDPRFPAERCDALYGRWLEESHRGYADALWVIEKNGAPAGYLSVHLRDEGSGQIGLVGVSETARGAGLGSRLLAETLDWAAGEGLEKMEVVTQGRNPGAQRLYQRHDFVTRDTGLWYHLWPDPEERP